MPPARVIEKRLSKALGDLPQAWESDLLNDLRSRDRRPSIMAKAALWFITLWFPLLQPIAAGLLEMFVESDTVHLAHGFYRLVTALSAAHLLAGIGVVAGIYVAILAGMYTRALRAVRRGIEEEIMRGGIENLLDQALRVSVLDPLLAPAARRLDRLSSIDARLGSLGSQAEAA